jgi:Helix-turn-helix domain
VQPARSERVTPAHVRVRAGRSCSQMATPDRSELPGFLTIEACAAILELSVRSVRRLIAAGELLAFKAGPASNSPWRVLAPSLHDFIRKQLRSAHDERQARRTGLPGGEAPRA